MKIYVKTDRHEYEITINGNKLSIESETNGNPNFNFKDKTLSYSDEKEVEKRFRFLMKLRNEEILDWSVVPDGWVDGEWEWEDDGKEFDIESEKDPQMREWLRDVIK